MPSPKLQTVPGWDAAAPLELTLVPAGAALGVYTLHAGFLPATGAAAPGAVFPTLVLPDGSEVLPTEAVYLADAGVPVDVALPRRAWYGSGPLRLRLTGVGPLVGAVALDVWALASRQG